MRAFELIVLVGMISLFADMTSDGYYSVIGPYLGSLGASAAMIAVIVGIAGLVLYTPRIASGWYCDQTGRYWDIMAAGLVINFLAVPMLALAGHWEIAFGLIIVQRIGHAIRAPARDAIISHAAKGMGGVGKAFGLHEAMSDIGSMIGPIIVAIILDVRMGYSLAIGVLVIPAALAIATVVLAMHWYPHPVELEPNGAKHGDRPKAKIPRIFWVYLFAAGLIAAFFIDYPLISYHMSADDHIAEFWIPVLYAVAMGLDALSAIIFGHIYDRAGMRSIVAVFAIAAFFVPLIFSTNLTLMIIGVILWGIGQGAIGSILRGAVSEMVPKERRGAAFGIFSTYFGVLWFLGSTATGVLYDISLQLMIFVSLIGQFVAVGIFLFVMRAEERKAKACKA